MKKGQTSVRGGIQDLLCPVVDVNITQGSNGSYSHKGSTTIDNASKKDKNLYAPCDCTCVAIDKQYAFVCWQSDNKVRFADGTIDYATFYFGHDSNINAKVGMKVKQGVLIAQEGTGGVATGVHSHIEVAKGKYTGVLWKPNTYGVYVLPNAVEFETAFFMDGTTITVGKANWKYLKDVSVGSSSTGNSNSSNQTKVDNILKPGDKFIFPKNYKLEKVDKNYNVFNSELNAYISPSLITETDSAGNPTKDQRVDDNISNSYFKIPGTFIVESSGMDGYKNGWVIPKGWGFKINAETLQEVA